MGCPTGDDIQKARVEKYDLRQWDEWNHALEAHGRKPEPRPKTPMLDRLGVGLNINTTCACNCPVVWQPVFVDEQGTDVGGYVHRKDKTTAGNDCAHLKEK